jgi:hypothetical protein
MFYSSVQQGRCFLAVELINQLITFESGDGFQSCKIKLSDIFTFEFVPIVLLLRKKIYFFTRED